MGLMTRHCRECGRDQLFDQPHAATEAGRGCEAGDDCPEWACTGCGAALIMGFPGLITSTAAFAGGAGGQRPSRAA
jgi:hypothetical protein